jgi:hypothetical protein
MIHRFVNRVVDLSVGDVLRLKRAPQTFLREPDGDREP